MSFTNAQLAQQIADLITYWSGFNEEYSDWLGGTVDGGPGSDGKYPLTNWAGAESLVDSPAKLADNVSGYVGLASASEAAAAASAAAALTSENNAAASEAQATSDAAAAAASASAASVDAGEADSSATVSTAQANLATVRVGYAEEWANNAFNVLVSAAAGGNQTDEYSARHWAEVASGFAGNIDANLYFRLSDNEVVTGLPTFNLGVKYLPQAAPTWAEGHVFYDSTEKALSYYNDEADVTINLGQENVIRVRNTTGVTITNGSVVYISGAQGANLPLVSLAKADALATAEAIGVVTHDIENNSNGYVTTLGVVRDLNTSSYTAGDELFLSTSVAGGLTNVKPTTGYAIPIGYVTVVNVSIGEIKVTMHGEPVSQTKQANWDTAYGWGDHAGLYSLAAHNHAGVYEPADATILKDADIGVTVQAYDATYVVDADIGVTVAAFAHNHSGVYEPVNANLLEAGTLTQADNFTLLNRTNASNPVLHVTQAGAGPVAQFGGGSLGASPTSDVVKINQGSIEVNGDGELLTLKNDNHLSSDNLLNSWIRWKDSAGTDMAWIGFGSNSNNDLGIYHSESGKHIRMGTVGAGDVLMTLGATGALEITGSSYKLNPTGLRLGQYTATIGYIQAPAAGKVVIWADSTAQIAEFNDDLSVNFAGPIAASNIPAYNSFTGGAIVTRHSSGYIFTNYLNMTADYTTGSPTGIAVETSSDKYVRWQTPANFFKHHSPRHAEEMSSSVNLNNLQQSSAGFYYQASNADTTGNNYPNGLAGSLLVQKSAGQVTQLYVTYDSSPQVFVRTYYSSWGSWYELAMKNVANTISGLYTFSSNPKRSSQGGYLHHNSSSYTDGGITFSTSARSGGTTGDIWFQYT